MGVFGYGVYRVFNEYIDYAAQKNTRKEYNDYINSQIEGANKKSSKQGSFHTPIEKIHTPLEKLPTYEEWVSIKRKENRGRFGRMGWEWND